MEWSRCWTFCLLCLLTLTTYCCHSLPLTSVEGDDTAKRLTAINEEDPWSPDYDNEELTDVKRRWSPLSGSFYGNKRQQLQQPAYRRWMSQHQRRRKEFNGARPCYWSLVSCY